MEYQTPATLNQAAPVQNTWYTILDTTLYCRVWRIAVNVEDTNETLEVRITIDGEVIPSDGYNATHSTDYHIVLMPDAINRTDEIEFTSETRMEYAQGFLIEGHSVKVEVRKTTAAGVGNLTGIVMYGVLTDVP